MARVAESIAVIVTVKVCPSAEIANETEAPVGEADAKFIVPPDREAEEVTVLGLGVTIAPTPSLLIVNLTENSATEPVEVLFLAVREKVLVNG